MRRRTFTTAFAIGVPSLALAGPALADGPGSTWTEDRTAELLERAQQLAPRLTPAARRIKSDLDRDRPFDVGLLERAIDGSLYQCAPTQLDSWVAEQIEDFTEEDIMILLLLGVLDWATYHALLFEPSGPQHYGVDGQHTKAITKTFRTLKRFWDIDGSEIQLAAMHGEIITDVEAMTPMLTLVLGVSEQEAREVAQLVAEFVDQPKFDHGNHPLFTFNAFAVSEADAPEDQKLGIPDKIIMGDGMLQAMDELGLGDVAPQGILAHEYGHHLQYDLQLFGEETSPEATRLTELEADAYAAYYLSHPRGERLRNRRVEQFVRTYFEIGDCSFESDGHHGTPDQREDAARWAYELANAKGAKGHVLPAAEVSAQFRQVLPEIIAPDA